MQVELNFIAINIKHLVWFGLFGFYAISIIIVYSMSNQFYTYKQFFFK